MEVIMLSEYKGGGGVHNFILNTQILTLLQATRRGIIPWRLMKDMGWQLYCQYR